ncbi:MAG: AMP-binding protein [Akkermansiaceae bacterium]|nr:AMP-binding protein [Akkermansiaceae bacterium]NNM29965.1 AMP-binding protein [Akkermansiaceae bacterium]
MNPPNNPWWEKTSHDELLHRQSKRLSRFLRDRVVPFAAYYRRLFEDNGIDPRDIKSTDDLVKIPFTSKRNLGETRDFVIIPDEEVLKKQPGTLLKVLRHGPKGTKRVLQEELRPVLMTSTTGRSSDPVPFLYTKHDLANLEAGGIRLMEIARSDPSFRHINAFPFAPHLAFWQAHYAGLGFNTFMLSTGGGKVMGTDGNARLISKINPDAIIGMPTFLYHLTQHAASENLRWTNLKRVVLGGEKVPLGMRRKLQSLCADLGSQQVEIVSTYGFTEAKMAWTECVPPPGEEPSGFHIYPDFAFIEIIDPETGERVPDGQPGEITFTPLDARGSVVLRYRTGDLIDGGLTHEPCPHCGRTCPRLVGKISRVSDIKRLNIGKLKGTLVDFSALEHVLDDTDGLGAWQIEIRKHNDDPLETDEILVHVVPLDGHPSDGLADRIRDNLRHSTELSPNDIIFHSWDEMRVLQGVGKELKEEKLVDHRPKAGEPETVEDSTNQ